MYYIYGQSGPSLLIESTDSMMSHYAIKFSIALMQCLGVGVVWAEFESTLKFRLIASKKGVGDHYTERAREEHCAVLYYVLIVRMYIVLYKFSVTSASRIE